MANFNQTQSNSTSNSPKTGRDGKVLSTQSHLNFAEVRDGIVIMRDGSLRMVVICSPTNYDLKSAGEKESIEYAYQGFLNGLHFPIQICIQSRRIDLDGYLDKLDQMLADQSNPLLADLMEDYIYNVRDLLQVANIMDKKFFVVVPLYTQEITKGSVFKQLGAVFGGAKDVTQTDVQFNEKKNDLIQRTNMVAQGLAAIGVRAAVLTTQEIIELFYSSYNVDESENQALVETDAMTAPIVMRDGGSPKPQMPQPKEEEPLDLYGAASQKKEIG